MVYEENKQTIYVMYSIFIELMYDPTGDSTIKERDSHMKKNEHNVENLKWR